MVVRASGAAIWASFRDLSQSKPSQCAFREGSGSDEIRPETATHVRDKIATIDRMDVPCGGRGDTQGRGCPLDTSVPRSQGLGKADVAFHGHFCPVQTIQTIPI